MNLSWVASAAAAELLHACPKNFQHVDLFPPLISSVCPSGIRPIHLLHYFWSSLRRRRSRSHRCSRQRVFSGCQISCQFVGFPVNQFKEREHFSLEKAINSHPSSSSFWDTLESFIVFQVQFLRRFSINHLLLTFHQNTWFAIVEESWDTTPQFNFSLQLTFAYNSLVYDLGLNQL